MRENWQGEDGNWFFQEGGSKGKKRQRRNMDSIEVMDNIGKLSRPIRD